MKTKIVFTKSVLAIWLVTLCNCHTNQDTTRRTAGLPKADELAQLYKGRYLKGQVSFSVDKESSLHAKIFQNGILEHELVLQREMVKNRPIPDMKQAEVLFLHKAAVISDLESDQQYVLILGGQEGKNLLEGLPAAYKEIEQVEGYGLAINRNMDKLYGSL